MKSTLRRAVAVGAVLFASLFLSLGGICGRASAVLPPQQEDDPTLTTETVAGVGGFGHPAVALVEITARRPLRATLVAGTDFGSGAIDTPIDLPTGGRTRVWLPLPSGYVGSNVVLKEKGRDDRQVSSPGFSVGNTMNVAVLPSLAKSVPSFRKSTTVRGQTVAQLVDLTLDDVEGNSWVLDSFDVVVATSADLSPLSVTARDRLVSWVRQGGELLIDDDVVVDGVPIPAKTNKVLIDRGTIRRSSGAIAGGINWDSVLVPTTRWSQNSQDMREWTASATSTYEEPQSTGLLARRSVKLPPGKLLIVGLFFYGLICAPMVFALLRRKRPMAIWVVGPLLATVLTGFVVVVGGVNRQSAKDLQVVVFDVGEGSPTAMVEQARTKSGTIKLPSDWYRIATTDANDIRSNTSSTFHAGRNPELKVGVLSGGVQTVRVRGPVEASTVPGSLEVTAKNVAGVVTGEVKNTGTVAIQSARILTPTLQAEVGQLQPGESKSFQMKLDEDVPGPSDPASPEARLELVEGAWRSGAQGSTVGLITALAVVDAPLSSIPLKGPKPVAVGLVKTSPIAGVSRMTPVFIDGAEEALRVDFTNKTPAFIAPFTPGSAWIDTDWQPWNPTGVIPESSAANDVLMMRKG
jgi:hypothetical protein